MTAAAAATTTLKIATGVAADGLELTAAQLARLNALTPAAGERHSEFVEALAPTEGTDRRALGRRRHHRNDGTARPASASRVKGTAEVGARPGAF